MCFRNFRCLFLLFALESLAACAHAPEPRTVYLVRTVQNGEEGTYPDPLRIPQGLESTTPENLKTAVEFLLRVVPLSEQIVATERASEFCQLTTPDERDENFWKCSELVCRTLPSKSRDGGCDYLVRVQMWVEAEWLGGLCSSAERSQSKLATWFRSSGIEQCYEMSTSIMSAFYRSRLELAPAEYHIE